MLHILVDGDRAHFLTFVLLHGAAFDINAVVLHCKEGVDLLAMLCYTFLLKVIVPTIWPLCNWFVRFKIVMVKVMVIVIVMMVVVDG